jgi:hypothetical protein
VNHTVISFSRLLSVGYNADKHLLEILFRDGATHQYIDVPSTIYFSLLNAYSPDRYFEKYIKTIFSFAEPSKR